MLDFQYRHQMAWVWIALGERASDDRRSYRFNQASMDLSPDVFFATTLEPGAVYYYDSEGLVCSSHPHYHVVLSASNPDAILLVSASTKIEQHRRSLADHDCPPDTLVLASSETEPYLRCQSGFDCNRPVVESLRSLSRNYARRPIRVFGPASPPLVRQLIGGILRSPLVERKYQDLLRGKGGDPSIEGCSNSS
jgi:hypothetical protein